jgi:hypothetical protein
MCLLTIAHFRGKSARTTIESIFSHSGIIAIRARDVVDIAFLVDRLAVFVGS